MCIHECRQNIISSTRLTYVYKCGDHYDACLPTNSQAKRQYFVDIKNKFPLKRKLSSGSILVNSVVKF